MMTAPRELVDRLLRWRRNRHRSAIVIIDNFPIDENLPSTHYTLARNPAKLTTLSEMILTGIGALLGDIIAFAAERDGELIQDLTPIAGKESALTNEGTAPLAWHNEHAITGQLLPRPIEIISHLVFMGLRPDPAGLGQTAVASLNAALKHLDHATVSELRKPQFTLRPPVLVRAGLPDDKKEIHQAPVLSGPEDNQQIQVALYGDLLTCDVEPGRMAIDKLKNALDKVQFGFPASPGTVVLVDNRLAVHARVGFEPRFDGNDRWLQRLLVTQSHWHVRGWHSDIPEVLVPRFA